MKNKDESIEKMHEEVQAPNQTCLGHAKVQSSSIFFNLSKGDLRPIFFCTVESVVVMDAHTV